MKSLVIIVSVLVMCLQIYNVIAYNLPGPRVYVVTPSPRPLQIDGGRSVPFYYHNWMRRMDNDVAAQNITTTTTTVKPKVMTPDLIFAEFESDSNDGMRKSIRKLLEKEKVAPKTTTTTSRPIYVPDEEFDKVTRVVNYGLPVNMEGEENIETKSSGPDYFSLYNKLYEVQPSPVYTPFTTQSTTSQTTTTPTTTPETNKVENIWHIIDSEKNNKYSGTWDEIPIDTGEKSQGDHKLSVDEDKKPEKNGDNEDDEINENFALPGFGSNPGNGAENESRAIRTEPNIRFPYVNLKPFQLKPLKKPFTNFSPDNKKTNSLMTSLDNFYNLKNPVRGEAQDVIPMREVIDRYNPAQPYLPPTDYGNKVSKQNSIPTLPKATANLVPPPPPPVPSLTDNDFPAPTNYESFPPYAAPSFDSGPPVLQPPAPKPSMLPPPVMSDDTSSDGDSDNMPNNKPLMDIGYGYKPPSPPTQHFFPTIPPLSKPFKGYSYDKPPMEANSPMMPAMDDKPAFHGYHYNKPESAPPSSDSAPSFPNYGHQDAPPAPPTYGHHDAPPAPPTYGHHDAPPSYGHDTDYPELIFQKNHGDMDDSKGGDDMKGMAPPPADMKPMDQGPAMDDHGFPSDFPADFKYHHDIDDHDFHYHHHHPTTTTTEMPRVNRYSYYYLGKKLYYLPLYFSVYFIVYVGALIIKAVLRHKIVYPNSWRPNDTTASFFSKRSVDSYLSNDNLHEVTGRVTRAIATAAAKYLNQKSIK